MTPRRAQSWAIGFSLTKSRLQSRRQVSATTDYLRQQRLGFRQPLLLMALISNISNGVESDRYVQTKVR